MDFKQLQYFLCVVDQGSFTKASRLLDVAQPALSRQVRLLEVELKQNLLIRTGRGVVATEAGRLLTDHGRRIMHQIETAREELGKLRGTVGGHVDVGIPTSLSKLLAVRLISEVRERLPGAALSISDGLSVPMHESILSGRLDMALLYKPQSSPDLDTVTVMKEELYLVCGASSPSDASPISLKEVADLPLVIPRRPHEIRNIVETKMASLGCKPQVMIEVDGVPAILDILADGPGYAVLPLYAVAIYSKSGVYRFRRIVDPCLGSRLVLATSSRRPRTSTQEAVFNLVLEICSEVLIPAINREVALLLAQQPAAMNTPPTLAYAAAGGGRLDQ
ncbi:LysR family transcriptional regulator [Pusillimonas caeni]|uniref:LysR substrate-binding domain-containing protein n=1 Tax=Pusillimonas caeni TaxID=1348472 RepID=UPI000E59E344|nr:LysR substrate-binding domain-containing protein [Pusillimonas caeni]TFL15045.1 LysR family transcriptional regulator [Pusillimonas caeni]